MQAALLGGSCTVRTQRVPSGWLQAAGRGRLQCKMAQLPCHCCNWTGLGDGMDAGAHAALPANSPEQAVHPSACGLLQWQGTDLDPQSVLEEGIGVPDGLLRLLGFLLGARVGKVKLCLAFGSCGQAQGERQHPSTCPCLKSNPRCLPEHSIALVWQRSGMLPWCGPTVKQAAQLHSCTVQMQQLAQMMPAAMAAVRRPAPSRTASSLRASSFCWRTVSHCACHSLMRSWCRASLSRSFCVNHSCRRAAWCQMCPCSYILIQK